LGKKRGDRTGHKDQTYRTRARHGIAAEAQPVENQKPCNAQNHCLCMSTKKAADDPGAQPRLEPA